MSSVTINGNTYSADGSTPKDMLNGGHRTHFIPLCSDVATVAGQVQNNADQTAIDAVNAADGANAMRGTSTTSTAVGAGTKTFTTQAGKQFTGGNYVTVSRTSAPATLMHGVVTSYSGTALVVDVANIAGSGTYTDWTIALSGAQGVQGPSGNGVLPYTAKTSAYTVVTTDRGSLIDCTSGTFTLSFQACATLGANWTTYIRNSGTGVVTLDPNGAETIDGVATYLLQAGNIALVQCDGSVLRLAHAGPNQMLRVPIFSPATQMLTAASSLENIPIQVYNTNLSGSLNGVIYGNSLYIAWSINTAQGNVSSSPDGQTWTLRAMPSSASWSAGSDGSSKFIASSLGTTTTAKSINGTTWSSGASLPAAAHSSYYRPVFNGSICLIFGQTAATCFTSSDNATSWSAAQTLPANTTSHPFVVGGLFWYFASGTTAYTSATGATGSWTARTLPITPHAGYLTMQTNGKLAISTNVTGAAVYESSDGINWAAAPVVIGKTSSIPVLINGIYSNINSTLGYCSTYANGAYTLRTSDRILENGFPSVVNGSILCMSVGTSYVATIDTSAMTVTGLYTK